MYFYLFGGDSLGVRLLSHTHAMISCLTLKDIEKSFPRGAGL